MSKIVVFLLCFGVITIQTSGQTNSDPAPGRSPGPPGINIVQDEHGGLGGETLILTQDPDPKVVKVKTGPECENKVQSFLVKSSENESGKVVLLDENSNKNENNLNENVELKVEVIHEIFDTKNGINCGLMYKSK